MLRSPLPNKLSPTYNVYLGANTTVTKAIRHGKAANKDTHKPRLMKVTVDSLESKAFILELYQTP